jgi:hypothetical protein
MQTRSHPLVLEQRERWPRLRFRGSGAPALGQAALRLVGMRARDVAGSDIGNELFEAGAATLTS